MMSDEVNLRDDDTAFRAIASCPCRVKSTQHEEALEKVRRAGVDTAETLNTVKLAWMPTLAGGRADGVGRRQVIVPRIRKWRLWSPPTVTRPMTAIFNKVVVSNMSRCRLVIDPFKAMGRRLPRCARGSPPARHSGRHTGRASSHTTFSSGPSATRNLKRHASKGPRRGDDQGDDLLTSHPSSPLETCK